MSSGRITLQEVLAACDSAGTGREPVTASEVSEELECTRRATLNKLDELAEEGEIESKKVGARSRVWWRPGDLDSSSDRRSASGRAGTDDAPGTTHDGSEASPSVTTEREHLEAELEEMFSRISEAFYALDDQWRFTFVSERAEELIDYRDEGLVGRNFWEVFEWAEDSTLGEEYRDAMESQEPTSFEFYYPVPPKAWYEVNAYPSETGLSVYFKDITDRKRRERQLEKSEHRYRALVEHFPNGAVALVDEDLRYRTVGGDPHDVANVTAEEIEDRPVREALPPTLADELVPRYEAALDGEADSFEAEYDDHVYEFQVVPVRDDDGDVFAALGMSWDVTERKQNQRKLAESERRYRTLVEHFPNGSVGLFDEDLRYTAVGGQLLESLDLSPDERIGRRISDIHPDDLLEEIEPYFRAALDGEANTFEVEYRDRHLSAHTLPVRNADGEVDAGMLVVQDVTERREARRELRESEAKFRMLAENLDEIVWMATADAEEFVYINPAFEDVWGLDREQLYDDPLSFLEAVHPDDRQRVRDAFTALPESEFDQEYRVVRPDGEIRWIHAGGARVTDEDGEMTRIVGIGEDVTEQKQREHELERALDLLDKTERIADVGGWEIDVDTQDVFWTDHVFDLLEVTADEEPPLDEALDMYHGEDQSTVEDAVDRAINSGESFDVEARIRTDSGDVRWLRLQGVPETVDGDVVSFRGAAQDVTEQVEREQQLEETVEQLEESNERLESFASMLAHELRNPVTIGQIYSQQLPTEADSEAVEYVTEAFDRIEDMIDVLLVLTRGREAVGDRTPVRLADAAREAWDKVEASKATLEVDCDRTIQADQTYVQHLFRNLFENAVEHGGRDVTVTVGELPSGFYVADDGSGIPPEERDAVFEAGYTTAAEQGGTGLGLAYVKELADVYGWGYTVTESANGGTRFEFTDVDRGAP